MSDDTESNKSVVRRQHDDVWNKADFDLIDSLYAEDFACHFVGGLELRGRSALREFIAGHRQSFPDWHEVIEDMVAERDRVVSRYRSTGTHRGAFQGIAASGKKVEITEVSVYRLAQGRIAEQWGFPDSVTLMRQIGALVLGVILWSALPVSAAKAADEAVGATLEEVVVTAQRREQNLQDVGTSITALNGEELSKLGLSSTTDIVRQVPGLQVQTLSQTSTVFNIRGVSQNDFSDHEEAPVAVYADDSYVAMMGALAGSMFDLKGVEVDRGPQGTLFGRNATGGLIQYISRKPTDTFEAYASLTAGSFGQFDTEGAISGPLSERVSARFAFSTAYNDGYVHNELLGQRLGNMKEYAGRLQFLIKLNDDANVLLKFHALSNPHLNGTPATWIASYQDPALGGLGTPVPSNVNIWGPIWQSFGITDPGYQSCAGCDSSGYRNPSNDPYRQSFDQQQDFHRRVYGSSVKVDWRLGDVATLTSVTDFLHMTKGYQEDTDESPNPVLAYHTQQRFRQFSQELRLNGQSGSLKWIAGAYFLDMFTQNEAGTPFGGVWGPLLGQPGIIYDLKTRTASVFGQVEWAFTDRLSAILGARETRDEKINNYAFYLTYPVPAGDVPLIQFNRQTDPNVADQVYNLPSWKLELDYKLDADTLLYGSINRGAKGGGFNEALIPVSSVDQLWFRPEKLTSYEVGGKTTFWNGRARINGDVYYYDYKGYQAFLFTAVSQYIVNYNARVTGGELEMTLLPVKGLMLRVGASAINSRVNDVTLPFGGTADRVLPNAPKWSVNAVARYEWQALNSAWWVQADAKTNTSSYMEVLNAPVAYQPGYTVGNLSAGFTNASGKIDLRVFANNVNDKRYRVNSSDVSSLGWVNQTYAPPRWYGVTATYHF